MEPIHRKNQGGLKRQRAQDFRPGFPNHRLAVNNVNNKFIKHNLADNLIDTSNWGQWTTELVNSIPIKATSNDFMDKKLLPCGLQNLIKPELWAANPLKEVPHKLTSSHTSSPACLTSPGFRCSGSLSHQVDYSVGASSEFNSTANQNLDDSSFFQGSLFEIYSLATSSIGCDRKNNFSSQAMKQVDRELVTSPEQISSITACSYGDAFSDTEAFDSGATFRDSVLQCTTSSSSENYNQRQCLDQVDYGGFIEKNQTANCMDFPPLLGESVEPYSYLWIPQEDLKSIPETADPLPTIINTQKSTGGKLLLCERQIPGSERFDQCAHQPYSLFGDQSDPQSNCFVVEEDRYSNQKVVQGASKVPQLSSEQVQQVNRCVVPESSAHLSNHYIINQYTVYKSMPENIKKEISFLQYMHLTECKDHRCNCEQYSLLMSHFDICNNSKCNICGPMQRPCGTNKRHLEFQIQEDDLSGAFCDRDSSRTSTGTLADILPPKRLKNENQSLDGKVVSLEDAPSTDLLCAPERLPRLEQWPEAPVFNVDVLEVKKKLFSPTEGPTITSLTTEDITSSTKNMVPNNAQPIFGHQQGPIELASSSDLINSEVNHSLELSSDQVPVSSENPTNDHKAIRVGSEANQAKLEANCSTISAPADCDSRLESEETKIQGVTLADVFSAAQIKEHLLSFSPWNRLEEAGNTIASVGQNTCQLCAKDKLVFGPAPLYCSACGNRIKRNLIYYSSLDEMGARLSFCTTCFKGSRGPNISFRGLSVSKAKLQKEKNNEEKEDSWVLCDRCQCWQHRVCGLYNDKRDAEGKAEYICPKCCLYEIQSGGRLPGTTAFGAKYLPRTKLSDHLEQRLFRRLKQEREEMANYLGKNPDEVAVAADLVIRVVVSVDKELKVKQEFLDIFHGEDYPAEFRYRSKVIFLFQKIEGVDVCLFGMCVQEFGSECSAPNQRCVYISYLDSVKYFRPERVTVTGDSLRTFVYHEILVGYLEYCKRRGFTTCYIWACPLIKGEDYIFYCHPETQKTPKQDKLRQWYKSMLKKAATDGVVVDYTNLYDCFFVPTNTKITAARLPYFEGDFWSGAAEDVVRKIEQEESGGGLQRKLPTKRTLKAMGHDTPSSDATKDVLVMQKLGQTILPSKENFLIVHLQFTCTHCHEVIVSGSRWFCNHCKKIQLCSRCFNIDQHISGRRMHACNCSDKNLLLEVAVNDVPLDTKDEDVVLENTFFENREAFLSNCQKDNYQFDTLAHAKYSSMMILYHLMRKQTIVGPTCSICNKNVLAEQCWHCSICPTFNVCESCYQIKSGACHTHNLSRPFIVALCGTKNNELVAKPLLDVLMHASKCKSKSCFNTLCGQIRRLFHHCTRCKVRAHGGCKACRKVWLILKEHSQNCSDSDCGIPRCMDLKNHRRKQQEAAPESLAST